MPLHDWSRLSGWDGVHIFWMSELARQLKSELPAGYRAYLGVGPALAIGAPPVRPDVPVRAQPSDAAPGPSSRTTAEPDMEVAVAALETEPSLLIERDGRLIAAIESISLRNKDRPLSRATYGRKYSSYLMEGVNLLLVDVHPRPAGFYFADLLAEELQMQTQPTLATPLAISYRVGEPTPDGGRFLAVWRYALAVGKDSPTGVLALDVGLSVPVDLEESYARAALDAYL